MSFLILQTGSTLPQLRGRHGDFPLWIRRGLGVQEEEVEVVRVDLGADLPDNPNRYAGVVVTGSPAMVSDRLDWSERTAAWLRGAVGQKAAVLGICYGHQLLAHALGGRVYDHPDGREVGTVRLERLPDAQGDLLLGDCPPHFPAHVSHQQAVLELPSGAVVLARSSHDPHHVVRYADRAWGLQFHPEFSVEVTRGYVHAHRGHAAAYRTRGAVVPARTAAGVLRRFRAVADRGRTTPVG